MLDSGVGGFSLEWIRIQQALARGLRLWPPTDYGNAMESAWMEL